MIKASQGSKLCQAIPGKGWFVTLRHYGPLKAWFERTWRPGEIGFAEQETGLQILRSSIYWPLLLFILSL
jgi:hypothetical protein